MLMPPLISSLEPAPTPPRQESVSRSEIREDFAQQLRLQQARRSADPESPVSPLKAEPREPGPESKGKSVDSKKPLKAGEEGEAGRAEAKSALRSEEFPAEASDPTGVSDELVSENQASADQASEDQVAGSDALGQDTETVKDVKPDAQSNELLEDLTAVLIPTVSDADESHTAVGSLSLSETDLEFADILLPTETMGQESTDEVSLRWQQVMAPTQPINSSQGMVLASMEDLLPQDLQTLVGQRSFKPALLPAMAAGTSMAGTSLVDAGGAASLSEQSGDWLGQFTESISSSILGMTEESGLLLETQEYGTADKPRTGQRPMEMLWNASPAFSRSEGGGGKLDAAMMAMTGMAQTFSPDFGKRFAEQMVWMRQQNIQVAEMRLNPRELGSILVRIDSSGDNSSVNFVAQNSHVRSVLDQNIGKLQELFAGAGLQLGDVNISSGSRQGDGQAESFRASGSRDHVNPGTEELESVREELRAQSGSALYLVDFFA